MINFPTLFPGIFRFQDGILKYVINGEYVMMQEKPVTSYLKEENNIKIDFRKIVYEK